MKQIRNSARGFSLLEMLAVLVILSATLLITMRLLQQQSSAVNETSVVAVQAQDMVTLENAAQQWVTTPANVAAWTPDTMYSIPVATLVTAGLLPAGFANRNSVLGTSPMFQTYVARAMISSVDSKPRLLISATGDPTLARLGYYGMQLSIPDVQSFNQKVAEKAQTLNAAVPAGVITNGAQAVTGNYGAFTENVASLYTTAPAYPQATLLYGFPDLGPVGGGPATDPNASKYKACEVKRPNLSGVTTCQTGWTNVASFPYCGAMTGGTPRGYAVYGTPVGDITLQSIDDAYSNFYTDTQSCTYGDILPDGTTCGSTGAYSLYVFQTSHYYSLNILLNGAVVGNDNLCETDGWQQYSKANPGGGCGAGYYPPGAYPCPYSYTTYNTILTNHPGANDFLCCLPN